MPLTSLPADQKLKRIDGLLTRLFGKENYERVTANLEEPQKEAIAIYVEAKLEAFYNQMPLDNVAFPEDAFKPEPLTNATQQAADAWEAVELEDLDNFIDIVDTHINLLIAQITVSLENQKETVITNATTWTEAFSKMSESSTEMAAQCEQIKSKTFAILGDRLSALNALHIDPQNQILSLIRQYEIITSFIVSRDSNLFVMQIKPYFIACSHEIIYKALADLVTTQENMIFEIHSLYYVEGGKAQQIRNNLSELGLLDTEIDHFINIWRNNCARYHQIDGVKNLADELVKYSDLQYHILRLTDLVDQVLDKDDKPVSMIEAHRLTMLPFKALHEYGHLPVTPEEICDHVRSEEVESFDSVESYILRRSQNDIIDNDFGVELTLGLQRLAASLQIETSDPTARDKILSYTLMFCNIAKNYDSDKNALPARDLLFLLNLHLNEIDRFILSHREEFDQLCENKGLKRSLEIQFMLRANPTLTFEEFSTAATKIPMLLSTTVASPSSEISAQAKARASQH